MFVDNVQNLPRAAWHQRNALALPDARTVGLALLAIVLIVGLATARRYGFTIDEFNTDDYGPKALAWYTSGFTDRSHFETVETWLWTYGPWFQMIVAAVQKSTIFDPITVRHALTFLAGLAGIAALLPLATTTVGRWAGPVAILLCVTTGYFYGHLFFTPIDVPFMAAMTWATLAVVVMARDPLPSRRATMIAGLATGLALGTRTGGIITHAYLLGAMALCVLEVVARDGRQGRRQIGRIALHTIFATGIAWLVAIALWPWLQIGNPFTQFVIAYEHFRTISLPFEFPHWGEMVMTDALPWSYVPAQLLVRLPPLFLFLLAAAIIMSCVWVARFTIAATRCFRRDGLQGWRAPALALAQNRANLVLAVAILAPIGFIIVQGTTMYDGIRHILFVIPLLALVAGGAFVRLLPMLAGSRIVAVIAVIAAVLHIGANVQAMARLHPLEYTAMNALAGGTHGAYGRFELDYWSAAATEALRRLERRLDRDTSGRFDARPARLMICIPWREWMTQPMHRGDWVLETDKAKADFLIGTERWNCGQDVANAVLIDTVERAGRIFAWTYATAHGKRGP